MTRFGELWCVRTEGIRFRVPPPLLYKWHAFRLLHCTITPQLCIFFVAEVTTAPQMPPTTTTHRLNALREGLHAWRQRGGRALAATTTAASRPTTTTPTAIPAHKTPPTATLRPAAIPTDTRRRPHANGVAKGVRANGADVSTLTGGGRGRARRGARRTLQRTTRGRVVWGTRRGKTGTTVGGSGAAGARVGAHGLEFI